MKSMKLIAVIVAAAIALISITMGFTVMSKPSHYKKTIELIDQKKATVMKLTTASAAASIAVAMVPGDATTPIAEKLADLTTGFAIVLCILFLEKYLLTLAGSLGIGVVIPIGCLLFILYLLLDSEGMRKLSFKFVVLGMVIAVIIPGSLNATTLVEKTYEASISSTIEKAEEVIDEKTYASVDSITINDNKLAAWDKIALYLKELGNKLNADVSSFSDEIKGSLNNMIESLVIMIVTSCLIPVTVVFSILGILKMLFNVNIDFKFKKSKTI